MDKSVLKILLIVVAVISILYNFYIIKSEINKDMEVKAEELKELGVNDYITIEPNPLYKSIWAVLNIQFYLFFISLIYGKSKETI